MKIGKTLGTLAPLLDNYDSVNNVSPASGTHTTPSAEKARYRIVGTFAEQQNLYIPRWQISFLFSYSSGYFACNGQTDNYSMDH